MIEQSTATQPVDLAGATLRTSRHICALFQSDDEAYRAFLPFIKEGFDRLERAYHVVDPVQRADHLQRLDSFGIDVPAAEQANQFEIQDWGQTYLREGRFDGERQYELIEDMINSGKQYSFVGTRLICHAWFPALVAKDAPDEFTDFESRVNDLLPGRSDTIACMYNVSRFGGDFIMDIMRAHPQLMIGGILQDNPFYVPPDAFRKELASRLSRNER